MIFYRFYHLSCVSFSIKKQGVKLCNMVNPKSKKQWYPAQLYEASAMPSIKSLTRTKFEPGKSGIRRMAMLNKMFMKQITDLMSTGTVSMDIVGRSIEISKVQVSPDFKTVNVFWVCKGQASDEETEKVLNKTAGALRHELSTLRIMGEIPYIVFVKDKQEAQLVDLDRRLAIAEYGDDFVPTEIGHLLKNEFTLNTKLSQEMKAKIKQMEQQEPITEEPIPEMTHNVYGLDHQKIMNRLLAARKKSRDAWSSIGQDSTVISYRAAESKPQEIDTLSQRKELADFLLKRQTLQNKLAKQIRNSSENWQLELDNDNEEEDTYYDDAFDDYGNDEFYNEENVEIENKDIKLDKLNE